VRTAAAEASKPFDLERGPVWRTTVVRLPADRTVLVITTHHLVSDGWSLGILFGELDARYRARRRGLPDAPAPPTRPFGAFVEADRQRLDGGERHRLEAHWAAVLDGAPRTLDLGASPIDLDPRAATVPVAIPAGDAGALAGVARRNRTSLFGAVTALFAVALAERSGQHDLLITTPVANRSDPASHGVIGCFLNTVPIRVQLRPGQTFAELVGACGSRIRTAVAHSLLPFAEISALAPGGRTPLGNTMIVHNNADAVPEMLLDVPARELPLPVQGVKHDWALHLTMSPAKLQGVIEFPANRFATTTMAGAAGRIEELATCLSRHPDAAVT
jgi:hypothetical protein